MNEPSRREKWSRPNSEVSANDWSLQLHVDVFSLPGKTYNRSEAILLCHLAFFARRISGEH